MKKYIKYLYILIPTIILIGGASYYFYNRAENNTSDKNETVLEDKAILAEHINGFVNFEINVLDDKKPSGVLAPFDEFVKNNYSKAKVVNLSSEKTTSLKNNKIEVKQNYETGDDGFSGIAIYVNNKEVLRRDNIIYDALLNIKNGNSEYIALVATAGGSGASSIIYVIYVDQGEVKIANPILEEFETYNEDFIAKIVANKFFVNKNNDLLVKTHYSPFYSPNFAHISMSEPEIPALFYLDKKQSTFQKYDGVDAIEKTSIKNVYGKLSSDANKLVNDYLETRKLYKPIPKNLIDTFNGEVTNFLGLRLNLELVSGLSPLIAEKNFKNDCYKIYINDGKGIENVFSNLNLYGAYLNKPYQFTDFPVDFKDYKVASVKFEGDFKLVDNPNYWNDWKDIFSSIENSDLDFAGHFKLVTSGNGTMRNLFLVDGLTGKIYPYKEMDVPNNTNYLFKNGSRLLVEKIDNELGFASDIKADYVYAYYSLQNDNSLKLLGAYIYKDDSFTKINN